MTYFTHIDVYMDGHIDAIRHNNNTNSTVLANGVRRKIKLIACRFISASVTVGDGYVNQPRELSVTDTRRSAVNYAVPSKRATRSSLRGISAPVRALYRPRHLATFTEKQVPNVY